MEEKAIYYDGKFGETIRKEDVPEDYKARVEEKREELVSQLAEIDEQIEELYLNGEKIPVDLMKEVIRKRTLDLSFCPVFMGSAYKNHGVQTALDGVIFCLFSAEKLKIGFCVNMKFCRKNMIPKKSSNKNAIEISI